MTPEQKCVSLETAKKLKEAGWNQFHGVERFWEEMRHEDTGELKWFVLHHPTQEYGGWRHQHPPVVIAAPDAQEIAGLLPCYISRYNLTLSHSIKWGWWASYRRKKSIPSRKRKNVKLHVYLHRVSNENLSEALAQMWLYLKEQGLL